MARHAASDRVNGVFDFNTLFFERVAHFAQRVLCLSNCHAVTGHDDNLLRVLHHKGRIICRALLDGA